MSVYEHEILISTKPISRLEKLTTARQQGFCSVNWTLSVDREGFKRFYPKYFQNGKNKMPYYLTALNTVTTKHECHYDSGGPTELSLQGQTAG